MGKQEDVFKEEAASLFDELDEVVKEMREDGVCLTEEIRRIADELDKEWETINELAQVEAEMEDEEDDDAEEDTKS